MTAPSPWAVAADLIAPQPPPPDRATPIGFAEAHSRGRWQRAPHLELIEQAILDTIANAGRLILSVSVRHGKSELASHWLPAWYLGTHPDRRVILAAHEADFAATWGRKARDVLTEHGPSTFGVQVSRKSEAANRWDLAPPHAGGMLTVGVGGSPIGRGGDLVIIDDPIKSWEAAMSPRVRQRTVEWWTGTMESRIEPGGAVILICARWHEDDLTGVLLREAPDEWREIRLPAICDDPDADPLGRATGEPLWPERYPLDDLERRHKATSLALGEQVWLAQFQQTPKTPAGGLFPDDRWAWAQGRLNCTRWVRGWDLAATAAGGDWTAGVLMGELPDGRWLVADVVRGQWSPDEVRSQISTCATSDPAGTVIELPQDPGQAGKDQGQQLVRMLAGHDVRARPQTGSKETRASGFSAQQRAGNVVLIDGASWVGAFVAELNAFPRGAHDDQVDAAATGFNALAGTPQMREQSYRNEALTGSR